MVSFNPHGASTRRRKSDQTSKGLDEIFICGKLFWICFICANNLLEKKNSLSRVFSNRIRLSCYDKMALEVDFSKLLHCKQMRCWTNNLSRCRTNIWMSGTSCGKLSTLIWKWSSPSLSLLGRKSCTQTLPFFFLKGRWGQDLHHLGTSPLFPFFLECPVKTW